MFAGLKTMWRVVCLPARIERSSTGHLLNTTGQMQNTCESGQSKSSVRYPGLDGLRGIAVATVVAFHLYPNAVKGGWLGVGIFFTLSGYLIIGNVDAEVSSTGKFRMKRFMARRIRRLMPAALATISATIALTAVLSSQSLFRLGFDASLAVVGLYNYSHRLAGAQTNFINMMTDECSAALQTYADPLNHFWSLAVEEQFYLIVPSIITLTRKPVIVVLGMIYIGLMSIDILWGSAFEAYIFTSVRSLEIAAGASLALVLKRSEKLKLITARMSGRCRSRRLGSEPSLAWTVCVLLVSVVVGLALAIFEQDHASVSRGAPQLMSICWVVLLMASLPGGLLAPLLSLAPLRWLGTRSYAIYLVHVPLVRLTDLNAWAVLGTTLIIAAVSYRVLEMPIRRQRGRISVCLCLIAAVCTVALAVTVMLTSLPAECSPPTLSQ